MKNRTPTLLLALLLLVTVGILYRYTERYQEGEEEVIPRNERITKIVKQRNITQADFDAMKEILASQT